MIRLIRLGEDNGTPPLVTVPGIDGSIGSVEPVVKNLSEYRPVIVADYSEENNESLEGLAAEIAAILETEVDTEFDLMGQSIGTIVAAQLATLHALPVRKVVLTCTFTKLRWNTLRLSNFLTRLTPIWLYRLTTRPIMAMVCGPVRDGADHPFFEASKNSDKADVIRRTAWQIDRDFTGDLEKIYEPLLILMGEDDRFVPDARKEIEKLRIICSDHQGAEIKTIPDAGHVFLPSQAITTATLEIDGFLS